MRWKNWSGWASLAIVLGLVNPVVTHATRTPVALDAQAQQRNRYTWKSLHMGTVISVRLATTRDRVQDLAKWIESRLTRYEDRMSVHKDTLLNTVNQKSGQWIEINKELARMVQRSIQVAKDSDGVFDPTINPLVDVWKIGFGGRSVPPAKAIERAKKKVDYRGIELCQVDGLWQMRVREGQSVDMGGIAKGFIGSALIEGLRARGVKSALIDLGGNVATLNRKVTGAPWRVGLQHPDRARNAYFAIVDVDDRSLITSGAYERYFEKDGKRYAHILSAKTGYPAITDISSVSILDRNGAKADAWCTALFAMGWDKATRYVNQHPELQVVLMHADLTQVRMSASLKDRIRVTQEGLKVEYLGESR